MLVCSWSRIDFEGFHDNPFEYFMPLFSDITKKRNGIIKVKGRKTKTIKIINRKEFRIDNIL